MFEIGKLYTSHKWCISVYETKEDLKSLSRYQAYPSGAGSKNFESAIINTNFWANRMKRKISFLDMNEPFLLLELDNIFAKVLIGEKIGWLVMLDWLYIVNFTG